MMESKVCGRCGRRFEWRKKWEGCWDEVKYCSQRCQKSRLGAIDAALEAAILDVTARVEASGGTCCPSEATRLVGGENWRELNERTRQAARRLALQGRIEILQKGRIVDPTTIKGPIRVRRRRSDVRPGGA